MNEENKTKIEHILKKARLADNRTAVDQKFANSLKDYLLQEFLNQKQKKSNIFSIFKFMKNRPKIIAVSTILSVLITSIAGMTLYYNSIASKSNGDKQIVSGECTSNLSANLKTVDGQVEIKAVDSDSSVWEKVEEGLEINSLFSVKTSNDSKAVVAIADGSEVRLNANTEVTFANLSPEEIVVDQAKGEVYHRVAKDPNREYNVISSANLESFNVTALGTAFNTVVNQQSNLNVKCIESKVNVNYDEDKPAELLSEGQEVIIDLSDRAKTKFGNIDGETLDNNWFKFNTEMDMAGNSVLGVFADSQTPELEILEPSSDYKTEHSQITIRGSVSPTALLKFKNGENWEIVNNNNGSFEKNVELELGTNTFEFKAYAPSGIKNVKSITIERLQINSFAQAPETTFVPQPQSTEQGTFQITSIRNVDPGKVEVNWKFEGYEERNGFKIVFSKNPNPEYPPRNNEDYFYYSWENNSRSAVIEHYALKAGGTYNFRVCRYTFDKYAGISQCDLYTHNIAINVQGITDQKHTQPEPTPIPTPDPAPDGGIILTKTGGENSIGLSWQVVDGLDVSNGYKIVWSRNHNPTYPNPDGYYVYVPGYKTSTPVIPISQDSLTDTWYVRICRYTTSNSCDVYSNEVRVGGN